MTRLGTGARDDDQGVWLGHHIGKAQHQLGARAGDRTGHMKPRIFVERAAVEHDYLLAGATEAVEFGGGDRRRAVFVLDDLGESLARHVGAREQGVFGRPGGDATRQDMECLVAEPGEAARRFLSDAVAIVDQHQPLAEPIRRHLAIEDVNNRDVTGLIVRREMNPELAIAVGRDHETGHGDALDAARVGAQQQSRRA
jgi:hypothetical protein